MKDIKEINKILKDITNKTTNFNPKKNLFEQNLDSLDVISFFFSFRRKI